MKMAVKMSDSKLRCICLRLTVVQTPSSESLIRAWLCICFIWFGSDRHLVDSWPSISVLFQEFYRVSVFQPIVKEMHSFANSALIRNLAFELSYSLSNAAKNQPLHMEVLSDILYSELILLGYTTNIGV